MKMTVAAFVFSLAIAVASAEQPAQPATTAGGALTAEQRAEIVAFFRQYSAAMLVKSKESAGDVKKSSFYEGNAAMAYYAANFVEKFDGTRFAEKAPLSSNALAQLGTRSTLKPTPPLSAAP